MSKGMRAGLLSLGLCVVLLAVPAWAEKRGVRVDGKAPAEFVAQQTGKSWAVVIGINDYEKVRRLTYAEADAKAVAETLRRRGFQVTSLYNRQATRNAILDELGDKLVERVGEHDRVLIYFAGHGETKQPKGGKEMGFLLPVEAEQEGLARTAIPMSLIRDLADGLPAKQVLFVVDVCYGGIAGQQFRSLPKYTEAYLKAITRERGRQLITAGGPKQEAMEGPEWGHSVFTYFLLEGLNKGTADLNDDGIIPASELYAYLDERVFSAAQMKGHQQRPVMWTMAAEKGEFVFFTSATGQPSAPSKMPQISGASTEEMAAMKKRLEEMEQRLAEQSKAAQPPKPVEVARARPYEAPRQASKEITGKDGAPMVLVPAGEFTMGSGSAIRPVHVDAFYMDKYEVTAARYGKFLKATMRKEPDKWDTVKFPQDADRPVTGADWEDANAYCRWAGKRLPTEVEWEKAARGTDGRLYPWGNDPPNPRFANYQQERSSSREGLAAVGSYEAGKSPYGLYDMAGNVWEWVADWYDEDYYRHGPNRNPPGPERGDEKVIRGGSWDFQAQSLLVVSRLSFAPTMRAGFIGFRCAQDSR